jgi:tetratricopeptide (TPR) repeat protein
MRINALLKFCGKPLAALLLLLVLVILVPACAPKKVVSIPPEWQKPPPAVESSKVPEVPAAASKQTAILKPPPAIKESDIAVFAETPAKAPEKKTPQAPPQHAASMHLVDQAKASLAQGKPDPAIPLLEQAIQIDVHNGEAFFSLARAWRMKGSRQKALQFSQKAELLFQDDRGKLKQVYLFEADLYKEMGETAKMDAYKQKASKLK